MEEGRECETDQGSAGCGIQEGSSSKETVGGRDAARWEGRGMEMSCFLAIESFSSVVASRAELAREEGGDGVEGEGEGEERGGVVERE